MKALAISALPLALLFGAAFQSSTSVPAQLQAILSEVNALKSEIGALQAQVTSLANKGPRKFYLTKTEHDGAEARSACAVGYHMASLREIHDTSNLRYDTDLGLTVQDSGFGPPSFYGWIRTGSIDDDGVATVPGFANCDAYTSASSLAKGTLVGPQTAFLIQGITISPWTSITYDCASRVRVWCVQD